MRNISPNWISGFVDAEGNFSINYHASGGKLTLTFKITQLERDAESLTLIKDYFKCGYICVDNRKTNGLKYVVCNQNDLMKIIIPHFDKYPLKTSKQLDFLCFKKVLIHLMKEKKTNLQHIINLKESMNRGRSFEQKWRFMRNDFSLTKEWILGFIEGEGCFYAYMEEKTRKVQLTLEIAQHTSNSKILLGIKNFFNSGYIKPKYDLDNLEHCKEVRSVSRLIITNVDLIINFFDTNKIVTSKINRYNHWKLLAKLKKENLHKTETGFQYMQEIKNNMKTK